jgi:small subunit ribosomal protein S17
MKSLVGKVSSSKMTGTVAVTVETFKMHPVYKKRLKRSKRFLAQIGEQQLRKGDLVYIREVRPVSKLVHFKVAGVLDRAEILTDVKHATKDGDSETETEAKEKKAQEKTVEQIKAKKKEEV